MRIICKDLSEFFENLKHDLNLYNTPDFCPVHHKSIHITTIDRQLGKEDSPRYEVIVQVGAVMVLPDNEEYFVEAAEVCGIDYRDASNELNGTKGAAKIKEQLAEFCEDNGLHIRPGILDY